MKRKFKVGDRVRVLNSKDEGVIISTNERSFDCRIRYTSLEFNYTELFNFKQLELIKEATPIKNISLERLDELIKAVNTLGSLGVEVKLKITVEIDGKKIEL